MAAMKRCCTEMDRRIAAGDIEWPNVNVYIHGKPKMVHDGGRHYDDMTPSFAIKYCPFCGKRVWDFCTDDERDAAVEAQLTQP